MNFFESHFLYTKKQRNGILVLILLVIVFQFVYFFLPSNDERFEDSFKSEETQLLIKKLDSINKIENQKIGEIRPFNPNYISDYKGYTLGMSIEEIDKLHAFRKTGKFINSTKEFKLVTGISDSLSQKIAPYFKFPDFISKKVRNKKKESPKEKTDINKATPSQLLEVKGVGEVLSKRIVAYRNRIQGYSLTEQLNEVWGLKPEVIKNIWDIFKIESKPQIQKININEASSRRLASIVYIDTELANKIIHYKEKVAEIQALDELLTISGFPTHKFKQISLYLTVE